MTDCACGRHYDLAAWSRLELVGHMADDTEVLELRNCRCGSTIAEVVAVPSDQLTKGRLCSRCDARSTAHLDNSDPQNPVAHFVCRGGHHWRVFGEAGCSLDLHHFYERA